MYLSKIMLQPSAQTAVELAKLNKNGAYSTHQLLWRLFTDESQRGFLYRQEIGHGGMPHFYVLSENAPSNIDALFDVQTKQFRPNFKSGQRLAFKLRANPTVCISAEAGKSKRHDVLMHAKRQYKSENPQSNELNALMNQAAQEWLANVQRLEAWGVSLDVVPEVQAYTQHKSKKGNGQSIQFSSVDYEGLLTILEPEKFIQQYKKGFGRAKSLGCGLMLIRPV